VIKTYKFICPNCNKGFWHRDKTRICCSKSCAGKYGHKLKGKFGLPANYYKPLLKLKCFECGNNFETKERFRLKFERNFCSMNCYNVYKEKSGMFKNKQRKGHKLTEEHKRKCSESLKGNPCWIKGKHHTLETRIKMHLSSKKYVIVVIQRLN
jgi:hypothetical protein